MLSIPNIDKCSAQEIAQKVVRPSERFEDIIYFGDACVEVSNGRAAAHFIRNELAALVTQLQVSKR